MRPEASTAVVRGMAALSARVSSDFPHALDRLRAQRVHRRKSGVSLLDILAGECDVSGCHGHGRMSHDVLQAECVASAFEVEQGEAVTKIVGADMRDSGFLTCVGQADEPRCSREWRSCRRAEERSRVPSLGADAQELVNGGGCGVGDRQHSGCSRLGYGGADADRSPLYRYV